MGDIPESIGRYRVERLLGQGAMGSVYLARDSELDRAVAIKTVRAKEMPAETRELYLVRFKNEARAAARLHDPGIVAVYDAGEDKNVGPYLVFEYVAGSSLKQHIAARGALEPGDVVRLAEDIGRAMDVAHSKGVVHRDIKPENLLVTPSGQTKLADFGVARIPDAMLTREGQFLGTPCYSAPETLRSGQYAPASDIFSFSAVLYEAITGKRAFEGDEALAVAHRVLHDEPVVPSAVASHTPIAVDEVILAGLSKAPAERPATGAAIARMLRDAYVAAGITLSDADSTLGASRASIRTTEQPPAALAATASRRTMIALLVGACGLVGAGLFVANGGLDPLGADPTESPIALVPLDGAIADDATSADAGTASELADASDASRGSTNKDAAGDASASVSAIADADAQAGAELDPTTMSPFEREEAAKDAVSRARQRLRDGDYEGARSEIARARLLDPGNSDIAELDGALTTKPQ